jgi:hypothetical protein
VFVVGDDADAVGGCEAGGVDDLSVHKTGSSSLCLHALESYPSGLAVTLAKVVVPRSLSLGREFEARSVQKTL